MDKKEKKKKMMIQKRPKKNNCKMILSLNDCATAVCSLFIVCLSFFIFPREIGWENFFFTFNNYDAKTVAKDFPVKEERRERVISAAINESCYFLIE